MIDLTYKKKVTPDKLRGLFRAEFALLGGPSSCLISQESIQLDLWLLTIPLSYSMVAISDKTFIFVNCASEAGGSSPGRVERARQISQTLEKKRV